MKHLHLSYIKLKNKFQQFTGEKKINDLNKFNTFFFILNKFQKIIYSLNNK